MARINYAIRAGSFAYCFVVLAVHGAERGFGGFFWAALALQFLAYPHLAYLHTRRAADSARAEHINLHADAAFLGMWVAALHFPLWIAYAAAFSITLNATIATRFAGIPLSGRASTEARRIGDACPENAARLTIK